MTGRTARRRAPGRPGPPAAFGVGVALVGVYVVVALLTLGLSGRVRPLFDGVGPPPSYQWVNPPSQFAKDNLAPTPGDGQIAFTGGRSEGGTLQTPDGQFVVTLGPGALAPHGADDAVTALLTPLDPGTLDQPPAGLFADGNAYRVQLTAVPSNQPVDTVATPGNAFITAPHAAEAILYSPDGRAWQRLQTTQSGGPTVLEAPFSRPGYYLAASTSRADTSSGSSRPTQASGLVVPIVLIAGAALLLFGGSWAIMRARGRRGRRQGRRRGSGRGGSRR